MTGLRQFLLISVATIAARQGVHAAAPQDADCLPLLMAAGTGASPSTRAAVAPLADFIAREQSLQNAISAAESPDDAASATLALARFYLAQEFYPEAALTIARAGGWPDDREPTLIAAQADYGLGRHEAVVAALDDERFGENKAATVLKALAEARLGAYAAARRTLYAADAPDPLRAEFHLLKAKAAFAGGEGAIAERALSDAGAFAPGSRNSGETALLRARLAMDAGDASAARAQLTSLVAANVEPAASRAALALLLFDYDERRIDAETALQSARALLLRWSGGDFEREALTAIAALARDSSPAEAFAALRRLAARHPRSDQAEAARGDLTMMLANLFDRDLAPAEAARLFYENIDYAPPGAAGDALIREVATLLAALDLLGDAAELLEHQVFKRLRGEERAAVAADLAALYLDDQRASDALRAIRSTRITGLAPDIVARRRLIEARALDRAGATESALALLSGVEGKGALHIRADIFWRENAWAEAAQAYSDLFRTASAPFDAGMRAAALRAAVAYLKAGDVQAFAAFREDTATKLAGTKEGDLLMSLGEKGEPSAAFLDVYRELFAPARAEG
jgi:hypothetical protein